MNFQRRIASVRDEMQRLGVDVVALSVGPDLPYLIGYEAMPLERLTMLVLPFEGDPQLVVPLLEAPRVDCSHQLFDLVTWAETDDPLGIVTAMLPDAATVAVGDHTWARFVLALQRARPDISWIAANSVTSAVRMVKHDDEVAALQRAATAVDLVATDLRTSEFSGRREIDIHRELIERMLARGHQRANFAIVAAAENSASPHHEPGERMVPDGDLVLCDFGGTMDSYCSDITRMFHVGQPSNEIAEMYAVLSEAQDAGCQAGVVGEPCESVDHVARSVIEQAGFGEFFVHRTGHGIGTEAHEDPYMVVGNTRPIQPGYAFSVEPGIYLPGRFGMRLEDIVVATNDGPRRLNNAARDLAVVG